MNYDFFKSNTNRTWNSNRIYLILGGFLTNKLIVTAAVIMDYTVLTNSIILLNLNPTVVAVQRQIKFIFHKNASKVDNFQFVKL